mmetsp:Transcript_35494/g.79562  ORF Transcript_35494/g.79562 Transcript_35494/m.79562 type:complete len:254 (+) Transcript_35494:80-841(+)
MEDWSKIDCFRRRGTGRALPGTQRDLVHSLHRVRPEARCRVFCELGVACVVFAQILSCAFRMPQLANKAEANASASYPAVAISSAGKSAQRKSAAENPTPHRSRAETRAARSSLAENPTSRKALSGTRACRSAKVKPALRSCAASNRTRSRASAENPASRRSPAVNFVHKSSSPNPASFISTAEYPALRTTPAAYPCWRSVMARGWPPSCCNTPPARSSLSVNTLAILMASTGYPPRRRSPAENPAPQSSAAP